MRFRSILLIVLLPPIFSGCIQPERSPLVSEHLATEKWTPDGIIGKDEYARSMVLFGPRTSGYAGGELETFWKNDAEILYIGLRGNTTGWLSIGFDPEEWMKNADIIIGSVESGRAIVLDEYSTGNYGPHIPDTELGGTNDILEYGGTEQNGQTTIEFKRKLNTSDRFDRAFVPGQNVSIIWAMADTDMDKQKHNVAKGEGLLKLEGAVPEPSPGSAIVQSKN